MFAGKDPTSQVHNRRSLDLSGDGVTSASKCFSYHTCRLRFDCHSVPCTWRYLLQAARRHLRLPLWCYLRRCTQAGVKIEALSVADSVELVVQHRESTETLGNPQASQPPGCIIISDNEEEPDSSGHAAAHAPPPTSSPPPSLNGPTRNLVGHTSSLADRTTARKSSSCESDGLPTSKRHKPLQRQSEASDRHFPSNAHSPAKASRQLYSTSRLLGDVNRKADIEGDMMQQDKEAGPTFELPSQMPRELQSWAWDKYACCLQQDTMHVLLPAFIVRLLLLQCCVFAVERVIQCLLIVCPEPIQ